MSFCTHSFLSVSIPLPSTFSPFPCQIFEGNSNYDTPELRTVEPLLIRFIRIYPDRATPAGMGLRLELLGCEIEGKLEPQSELLFECILLHVFYLNNHFGLGAKRAKKASSNGIFTYDGDISTCGADFSTSSKNVSTGGSEGTTQSETFFFTMLMTFPAMVTLLTTTPGVNVTTRDYLLVQMGIFFPRRQPYWVHRDSL